MGSVAANLAAMGTEQLLLLLLFLASYALALGRLAGARSRLVAVGVAFCTAVGFVVLSSPWEAGVILLAWAPIGTGLFAGTAWTLWKVTANRIQPAAVMDSPSHQPVAFLAPSRHHDEPPKGPHAKNNASEAQTSEALV